MNTKQSLVNISRKKVNIPTYEPPPPDKNPTFLERRVYQGSSGRVYPMPCVERFSEKPTICGRPSTSKTNTSR